MSAKRFWLVALAVWPLTPWPTAGRAADPPAGKPAAPAGPADSDWERMRQQLRGVKPPPAAPAPPAPAPTSKLPAVTDGIFKLLVENGRHLGQLAEGESVTVAVTFRDTAG